MKFHNSRGKARYQLMRSTVRPEVTMTVNCTKQNMKYFVSCLSA